MYTLYTRALADLPCRFLLQPFFFNVSFPPVINYGGIGMIMGHELTHGFDAVGRKFDGNGSLTNWWPAAVNKRFVEHASCFERQVGSKCSNLF
jgi:predicted metalloendopeptidase